MRSSRKTQTDVQRLVSDMLLCLRGSSQSMHFIFCEFPRKRSMWMWSKMRMGIAGTSKKSSRPHFPTFGCADVLRSVTRPLNSAFSEATATGSSCVDVVIFALPPFIGATHDRKGGQDSCVIYRNCYCTEDIKIPNQTLPMPLNPNR
jgi:hypothetical protein